MSERVSGQAGECAGGQAGGRLCVLLVFCCGLCVYLVGRGYVGIGRAERGVLRVRAGAAKIVCEQ